MNISEIEVGMRLVSRQNTAIEYYTVTAIHRTRITVQELDRPAYQYTVDASIFDLYSESGNPNYKKEETEGQITYILKDRQVGVETKTPGIIVIQKIPKVDIDSCEIISYIYSVKTSRKYSRWTRFKNLDQAEDFVSLIMKGKR